MLAYPKDPSRKQKHRWTVLPHGVKQPVELFVNRNLEDYLKPGCGNSWLQQLW